MILAPVTQTLVLNNTYMLIDSLITLHRIAVVLTNRMLINIRSYRNENSADVESSVPSYGSGATAWIKSSLNE